MPEISLSNSKGRDAQVMAESVRVPLRVRWLDEEDRQAVSVRLMKGTIDRDYNSMLSKFGGAEKIAEALIAGDPEIDPESVGSFMRDTSRVYVNSDRQIVYGVNQIEIVRNPDGTEKTRRPKKMSTTNVTPEQPLMWSGSTFLRRGIGIDLLAPRSQPPRPAATGAPGSRTGELRSSSLSSMRPCRASNQQMPPCTQRGQSFRVLGHFASDSSVAKESAYRPARKRVSDRSTPRSPRMRAARADQLADPCPRGSQQAVEHHRFKLHGGARDTSRSPSRRRSPFASRDR